MFYYGQIESLFEQDLKVFKLYRTYKKLGTEFFIVSTKYSIEYLLNHIKGLIL